jgi:hypothetical protein
MTYARLHDDFDENDIEAVEELEKLAGSTTTLHGALGKDHSVGAKHKGFWFSRWISAPAA